MFEPKLPGTIVRTKTGDLYVRLSGDMPYPWADLSNTKNVWDWSNLSQFVQDIVCPGVSTKEPQNAFAVVRAADGWHYASTVSPGTGEVSWIYTDGHNSDRIEWYEIQQPVKILFNGVSV